MILVDTHTHLYSEQFAEDRSKMIKRAIASNVEKMYLPNVDMSSIEGMLAVEKEFPENCFAMMGLHPTSVKADYKSQLKEMEQWLERRDFVAIGEIGIDLYWDKTFKAAQIDAFKIQIEWAKEKDIPFVIHARDATAEVIEVLKETHHDKMRGIFHCFGGSTEEAHQIIELGFYLGIGGIVTFKNSKLGETLEQVDLKHIVLETDAPYLTPMPYRGKRNESSYINFVAEKLTEVKKCSLKEIAKITTENALNLFEKREKM